MADDKKAPEAAPKSPGLIRGTIVACIVVLVFAIAGLAAFQFMISPMLRETPKPAPQPAQPTEGLIPAGAIPLDFDEAQASVLQDKPDAPSSLLMYAVSMICANEPTRLLVANNKQWFVSMLDRLHRNRTKSELADPAVERSICKQALEEANSILRRLQQEPDSTVKIIEVLHLKFTVLDI